VARIVVALGGNALLKRGEALTASNQRKNARIAAEALAPLCAEHEVVITHGNGPQVGLLALQELAYPGEDSPLDVLGAETEGMIGYMIEQELGNLLPFEKPLATLLTMVEVDPDDPAFADPTKFVGQVCDEDEAKAEAAAKGWVVKPDGDKWRRVVPSPLPKRIFQIRPVQWLLEKGTVVIAAGGGGIPTMYEKGKERHLVGVECVIDKDRATALLAREIGATVFACATDADAVYVDWGKPTQKAIAWATPDAMDAYDFPAGSMGPKVEAAQEFARATGGRSIICSLADMPAAVRGDKGTTIAENPDPEPGDAAGIGFR
jgi:carbamate kinase